MMKRILAASAAVASLAAIAAPAFAVPAPANPTANLQVSGNVPATCELGGLTGLNNDVISLDNSSGSLIQADGTVDTSGAKTVNLTGAVWCNGTGSSVTLNAKALRLVTAAAVPPAPPTGFVNVVSYQVSTNFPGFSSQSLDSGTTVPGASATAVVGAFITGSTTSITVTADSSNGNKLIAGTYQGAITITVTPS